MSITDAKSKNKIPYQAVELWLSVKIESIQKSETVVQTLLPHLNSAFSKFQKLA